MAHLARKRPEPVPIDAAMQSRPSVEYPYGCCLSFDDDTLAALGLDGMPAPGDVFEFFAKSTVTSARKDPVTGECRVELQITDIEPHEEESAYEDAMEESAARRGRWYSGSGEKAFAPFDGNSEVEPHP